METDAEKGDKAVQEAAEAKRKADEANRNLIVLPIAFAIGIVGFLILIFVLHVYISPESAGDKNGLFQASASIFQVLAIIIGGMAAYIGLYLTWRENTRQTIQLGQKREITERYTHAVNQLGHDSLGVRSGGIYALERIAMESEEYSRLIPDLLTDYIKHRAPWRFKVESAEELSPQQLRQPAVHRLPDVQAILTELRRRRWENRIDLRGTDLRRGELHGAFFEQADLSGTDLRGANLRHADLNGSHLNLADLRDADLSRANLEGADLRGANLEGTALERANLERTNLFDTNLTQEQIERAHGDRSTILPEHRRRPSPWIEGANQQPS